jgi:outer membrane protein assembly factor BamD
MQIGRKNPAEIILQFIVCNLLFAIFVFLAAGCSSLPSLPWSTSAEQSNPTAEALFEEGMTHFKNKKYVLAIDRFQRLRSEFPFSQQLTAAELKLGESYYLNKQYPEAAAAFKEFQTLHPTNENIPFVVYHLGLVHLDQFSSIDRDQKMTEIAKGYFETVVKNHHNSPFVSQAKEKLIKCLDYLAEHEFNIASFYFQEKKYAAAIDRLEQILRRYRDTSLAPKALYYLGESYRLDKNPLKATLAYEAFIQYFPDDPLAKTAQTYLNDLVNQKVDPLAVLLKRDGRPTAAASLSSEKGEFQNPKPEIRNPKELNLVAKKDVVHEEPGDEKGFFRRISDKINPFVPSSKGKRDDEKKIETVTAKEESPGFLGSLWRGINPFAKGEKIKVEAARDPQLVGLVDQSLNQQGIDTAVRNVASTPPTADLPKVEEAAPAPTNTLELLSRVDATLQNGGKNINALPSTPEIHPVFGTSIPEVKKPPTTGADTSPAPPSDTSGLITSIDQGLKSKGIDPTKVTTNPITDERQGTKDLSRQPAQEIELSPRLNMEQKPFFLDPQAIRVPEAEKASEPKEETQTNKPTESVKGLPQAVVTGLPQPQKESRKEVKAADKKKPSEDENEESKGVFDQLKEDVGRLKSLLNPFSW